MSRHKYVIGNWKQNGSLAANAALLAGLRAAVTSEVAGKSLAVCVPAVYLAQARDVLAQSHIGFGAQNCSATGNGAFTGEIAADMIAELGASLVLVGHSERRALFAESDAAVGQKAVNAIQAKLTPVVCVGETLAERDAGKTFEVVERQLMTMMGAVKLASLDLSQIILAYEPVWAIGTGKTATNERAQEVHAFLRGILVKNGAANVSILYGGSVKPSNAAGLFSQPDIDGGLVGGASLVAADFLGIWAAL